MVIRHAIAPGYVAAKPRRYEDCEQEEEDVRKIDMFRNKQRNGGLNADRDQQCDEGQKITDDGTGPNEQTCR